MKTHSSVPPTGADENRQTLADSPSIDKLSREWLPKSRPKSLQTGLRSLDLYFGHWEPGSNYVIAGEASTGARSLSLTLAENFLESGGHVVWIGITEDLGGICEQLMFRKAGLELDSASTHVQLDAIAQINLAYANEQVSNMWADFCNVDECGDIDLEQVFLASVSSFKPTLILVEESIFDETTLNPFEVLVRQTHAQRMVNELRTTNPFSSVVWHLPMSRPESRIRQRPSLDDLPDAASAINPDVVLLTHRNDGSESKHTAELIVAANAYGPIGTVPMIFDPKRSTWHEFDDAA